MSALASIEMGPQHCREIPLPSPFHQDYLIWRGQQEIAQLASETCMFALPVHQKVSAFCRWAFFRSPDTCKGPFSEALFWCLLFPGDFQPVGLCLLATSYILSCHKLNILNWMTVTPHPSHPHTVDFQVCVIFTEMFNSTDPLFSKSQQKDPSTPLSQQCFKNLPACRARGNSSWCSVSKRCMPSLAPSKWRWTSSRKKFGCPLSKQNVAKTQPWLHGATQEHEFERETLSLGHPRDNKGAETHAPWTQSF